MQSERIIQCQFSTNPVKEMHFHPDVEILYVLDGILKVDYENSEKELKTDDFIVVNTNVRHKYEAEGDILVGSIFIQYTQLIDMFQGEPVYFLCNSAEEKAEGYDKIRYYIRQIFNYYHTEEGQGVILRNSIAYQLLYTLTSEFIVKKGMSQYDSLRGISEERMSEILNYLMNNYHEQVTLQGLADKLYLSNAYLSKYIKKNFGMSFLKLLNNIRMEHAVSELLYSDKSVMRIAMDNGFPNLAGFNRTFREIYHITPAEYRKDMMEKTEQVEKEEVDVSILEKVEHYLATNSVDMEYAADTTVHTVEADMKENEPYEQNWNKMINIGYAADLLRYDCREQVRFLKEQLGFEYVRIWNIFSNEMMIRLGENKTNFNFTILDKVFDFLVELKIKPFLELGFKTKQIYESIQKKLIDIDNENQFDVLQKNRGFLVEFAKHLVKRYGVAEVESWYIELEKNSIVRNQVNPQAYANAFEGLSDIFRSFAPNIKVGGAGLSLNYLDRDFRDMLRIWKKQGIKLDFLSIYSYPYIINADLIEAGRNDYSADESYLNNQIKTARQICMAEGFDVPRFFVTEWSFTLSNRNVLNDCCFKSAYVMKNMIQNMKEADLIGYWVATDLFSDFYDTKRILFGGCGLLSRDMIRKPVYYAYRFLGNLEKNLIKRDKNSVITTDGVRKISICCHNYKHFNFRYYLQEENEINLSRIPGLYEDNESLQINFNIKNLKNGTYQIKKYFVNTEHGDIQSEWQKLDFYDDLSKKEIEYYKEISQPGLFMQEVEVINHTLELETSLLAQEIQNIIITEI